MPCASEAAAIRVRQKKPHRPARASMPGFIHSSPAMTRLVEEVHKIRSSDVTVLRNR